MIAVAVMLVTLAAVPTSVGYAAPGTTTRVSVNSAGAAANASSSAPNISGDGRFAVFQTSADNLVAGDTNFQIDIFVHDRLLGETSRINLASDGTQSNGLSHSPQISADGRFVVFVSAATNLVAGDTNGRDDIFVRDRAANITARVSLGPGGIEANDISHKPSISDDGRFVAFSSHASNLIADDTNGAPDIFVHDRQTGQTTRVSVGPGGVEANATSSDPSISASGNAIVFVSTATNLTTDGYQPFNHIFQHDRLAGHTSLVTSGMGGVHANSDSFDPSVSADGQLVAFQSLATNLVAGDTNFFQDVFVSNVGGGSTSRVSVTSVGVQGNSDSVAPSISDDGRYVAFGSGASNLVDNDTNFASDVFLHDQVTGATTRVSVDSNGVEGNNLSQDASVSTGGHAVAFASQASNLVAGDTAFPNNIDIFVNDSSSGPVNAPPVVDAGTDINGETGATLALTGSVVDDDSPGVTGTWSVVADTGTTGTCQIADVNAASTTVSCDTAGTYTATLMADDGISPPVSDSVAITISDPPPPPPAPVITALDPDSAPAGSDDVIFTIDGSGFTANSVVFWDGTPLETTFILATQISAVVPVDYFAIDDDFVIAAVTVVNVTGASNALPFSIAGPLVTDIESAFAGPGETVAVSTAPQTLGQAGLTASLTLGTTVTGLSTLTAATYSSNPVATTLAGGYGFVDLRLFPNDPHQPGDAYNPTDSIRADYYVPPNPIRPGNTTLPPSPIRLMYWSGTAWSNVLSSGGSQPVFNPTANLDGTQSLARFSVVFDVTSTPSINALGGTVFAFIEEELPQTGQDVSVTLTATPDPVRVSQELTYTLTVTNHGPETAKNVLVTGNLLSTVYKVRFVSFSGSLAGVWCLPIPLGSVTCTLGDLPAGASRSFTIVVKPGKPGTIAVNVRVRALSPTDLDLTNNSASTVTTVQRKAPLQAGWATCLPRHLSHNCPIAGTLHGTGIKPSPPQTMHHGSDMSLGSQEYGGSAGWFAAR